MLNGYFHFEVSSTLVLMISPPEFNLLDFSLHKIKYGTLSYSPFHYNIKCTQLPKARKLKNIPYLQMHGSDPDWHIKWENWASVLPSHSSQVEFWVEYMGELSSRAHFLKTEVTFNPQNWAGQYSLSLTMSSIWKKYQHYPLDLNRTSSLIMYYSNCLAYNSKLLSI